jgi:hypothetical protein
MWIVLLRKYKGHSYFINRSSYIEQIQHSGTRAFSPKETLQNRTGTMTHNTDVNNFFFEVLHQYKHHIRASGAYNQNANYPLPNLANDILPMFTEWWVIGPGQHTPELFHWLKPAFKLASRLLTEKFPLLWFCHLTFGDRRPSRSGTYIVPNEYSTSADAIARVRDNIRVVGELVTLMFHPPGYPQEEAYGLTGPTKHGWPFSRDYRNHWPAVRRKSRRGHARPLIVIHNEFQTYFRRHASSSTQDEHYRVLLLFVITLVHEFAHAYEFWLSPERGEPRWSKWDKDAELRWSWEATCIGYGLHYLHVPEQLYMQNRYLYQVNVLEYNSFSERERVLSQLAGSNRTDHVFTRADASGRIANPPRLDANHIRDGNMFFNNQMNVTNYIAAAQVVPMEWVVLWFREEEWQRRAEIWRRSNVFIRPSLGNAFMLLYERSGNRTSTLRPLYPAFPVDKEILDRRTRGDYSR